MWDFVHISSIYWPHTDCAQYRPLQSQRQSARTHSVLMSDNVWKQCLYVGWKCSVNWHWWCLVLNYCCSLSFVTNFTDMFNNLQPVTPHSTIKQYLCFTLLSKETSVLQCDVCHFELRDITVFGLFYLWMKNKHIIPWLLEPFWNAFVLW